MANFIKIYLPWLKNSFNIFALKTNEEETSGFPLFSKHILINFAIHSLKIKGNFFSRRL